MFNNEPKGLYTSSMGPRISFSNDFADTQLQAINKHHQSNYKEAPVSSDFQFSVPNNAITTADEIFFKGMLLPNYNDTSRKTTTLRDELLNNDECEDFSPRLSKSLGRWKERLGLKRCHIVSKKGDNKSFGGLERVVEEKSAPVLVHEDEHVNKKTQELMN